jgi:hypothetical protein
MAINVFKSNQAKKLARADSDQRCGWTSNSLGVANALVFCNLLQIHVSSLVTNISGRFLLFISTPV